MFHLLVLLILSSSLQAAKLTEAEIKAHMDLDIQSWPIKEDPTTYGINLKAALPVIDFKEEVVVGIIDTGINIFHPALGENLINANHEPISAKNFGQDFTVKNLRIAQNSFMPFDTNGHGSNVASIIKSVCVKCKLLPFKYYLRTASGSENLKASLLALEKFVMDEKIKIINYSGGGTSADSTERWLLKKLAQRTKVILVAAAGNDGKNLDGIDEKTPTKYTYYPASYNFSNIFAVGAHGKYGGPLYSSNYGASSVLISAPGEDILGVGPIDPSLVAHPQFMELLNQLDRTPAAKRKILKEQKGHFRRNLAKLEQQQLELANRKNQLPKDFLKQAATSTVTLTGTSQATAFVSGTVALLMMAYPELSVEDLRNVLIAGSNQSSKEFKKKNMAEGTLNVAASLEKAKELVQKREEMKRQKNPKTNVPKSLLIKPVVAQNPGK